MPIASHSVGMMSTFSVKSSTTSDVLGARVADDADDRVARLEEAGLLDQALVAELLAVIGGDDDDRVRPTRRCLQHRPHPRRAARRPR